MLKSKSTDPPQCNTSATSTDQWWKFELHDTSATSKAIKTKWCNFELLAESLVWHPKVRSLSGGGQDRVLANILQQHDFKTRHRDTIQSRDTQQWSLLQTWAVHKLWLVTIHYILAMISTANSVTQNHHDSVNVGAINDQMLNKSRKSHGQPVVGFLELLAGVEAKIFVDCV